MKIKHLAIPVFALLAVASSCKKEEPFKTYFKEIPWTEDAVIPADMAVDLGICNHLKWRSGNLGAKLAQDFGDYYAWGETDYYYNEGDAAKPAAEVVWKPDYTNGYSRFWESYSKFTSDGSYFNKYSDVNASTLKPEDDAAHVTLGGKWRMPTESEFLELLNSELISVEQATLREKDGWKFTSKVPGYEGNYIFLPAAGDRIDCYIEGTGTDGNYWSSTLHTEDPHAARVLEMEGKSVKTRAIIRYYGFTIRPVCD